MDKKNQRKQVLASFNCRLPIDLNRKLEENAESEKRTKNSQIQWILENYLNKNSEISIPVTSAQTAQVSTNN